MQEPWEQTYSFKDILEWDTPEQMELICGVPIAITPPRAAHQFILGNLYVDLRTYLDGKQCRVVMAPFAVRLFEEADDSLEDVDTMVEPDLTIICDPSKLDEMGYKGAPDMIIEILSPFTRRRDKLEKYRLYELAGVREYWIVDPETRTIQVFVLEGSHYVSKETATARDQLKVHVLEDCVIDLNRIFAI